MIIENLRKTIRRTIKIATSTSHCTALKATLVVCISQWNDISRDSRYFAPRVVCEIIPGVFFDQLSRDSRAKKNFVEHNLARASNTR